MQGLMIHDARDKERPPVTIIARKGQMVMDGNIPNIIVFDGMRQQADSDSGNLSKLYFSRYTIEIKGLEGAAREHWRGPGERSLGELLAPDLTSARDRNSRAAFLAEANRRIVAPWNALSFTMVALAAILLGPFNRRGQNMRLLLAAALIVVLQTLTLALANVSKKYPGILPFMYMATILPACIGFYLLHLKGEQQLMALVRWWNRRFTPQDRAAA
jgi:lipopolysaccharide export system permease protein